MPTCLLGNQGFSVFWLPIALIRGTRHLAWDWQVHAHHHLVAQITGAVGLAVVSLALLVPMNVGVGWSAWRLGE